MKAASIVGYKNSGKTTLMLKLVEHLSDQGLRVAAAKYTHHELDRQGSDTELLSRRAHCVAGFGQAQTSVFWNKRTELTDLLPLLDSDILLIEGGRHLKTLPRIVLPRSPEEAEPLADGLALAVWSETSPLESAPACQDVANLADRIIQDGFLLPGLDCQACGYETCGQLASSIVADQARPESCQAVSQSFTITINGQEMAMNPFVRSIISGSILGMVSKLKGFSPGTLDIHMDM
jgi:molybdopterin-guanine dinucleotide biosynthesis protein B